MPSLFILYYSTKINENLYIFLSSFILPGMQTKEKRDNYNRSVDISSADE